MIELLESEKRKFSKLMELEGFGYNDILKLKNSTIGVVGLTGIGISALLSIIPIGVAHVKVVDFESIDETILPQGTFFGKGDIGKLKTIALKEKLTNSWLVDSIKISNVELRESNINVILEGVDIVIFADYNPQILQLIATYCELNNIPLVWTAGSSREYYLMYADCNVVKRFTRKAIEDAEATMKSGAYYPSTVSAIAGGAAAALTINALLNRAEPMLRKCDVNTFKVDFIQPD